MNIINVVIVAVSFAIALFTIIYLAQYGNIKPEEFLSGIVLFVSLLYGAAYLYVHLK